MNKLFLALLASTILAVGCGGGGGGGGTDDGGGNPPPPPPTGGTGLKLFLTDGPLDLFDKVWVRIHKIELVTSTDSAQAVFQSEKGLYFDLRRLNRQDQSRYVYLGQVSIQSGNYAQVRVTLDDGVELVPRGGGDFQKRKFDESTAEGFKVISYPLNEQLSNNSELIVDFDLEQWREDGSKITTPVIQKGVREGLADPSRQLYHSFEGTVQGLTGTDKPTFTLQQSGLATKVVLTERSVVYTDTGEVNPSLANGADVHVRGSWSETEQALVASSVSFQRTTRLGANSDVEGRVLSVSGDSFTIRVDRVDGYSPAAWTTTVTVATGTRYYNRSGMVDTKEAFFQYLNSTGRDVEVEGSYSFATNTLTAARIKAVDDAKLPETKITGAVSNVNGGARNFSLTVGQWLGAFAVQGRSYSVALGTDVRLINRAGSTVTADVFFAELQNGGNAEVTGTVSGSTISATRIRIL